MKYIRPSLYNSITATEAQSLLDQGKRVYVKRDSATSEYYSVAKKGPNFLVEKALGDFSDIPQEWVYITLKTHEDSPTFPDCGDNLAPISPPEAIALLDQGQRVYANVANLDNLKVSQYYTFKVPQTTPEEPPTMATPEYTPITRDEAPDSSEPPTPQTTEDPPTMTTTENPSYLIISVDEVGTLLEQGKEVFVRKPNSPEYLTVTQHGGFFHIPLLGVQFTTLPIGWAYYVPAKEEPASFTTIEALTHLTQNKNTFYGITSAGKYLLWNTPSTLECRLIQPKQNIATSIPLDATWVVTTPTQPLTLTDTTIEAIQEAIATIRKTWQGPINLSWTVTPEESPFLTTSEAIAFVISKPSKTLYGKNLDTTRSFELYQRNGEITCYSYISGYNPSPTPIPMNVAWTHEKYRKNTLRGEVPITQEAIPAILKQDIEDSSPCKVTVTLKA